MLNDKWYNVLKYLCLIALPALATFCLALFNLLEIPKGAEVAGVITLVDALLGTLLGVSTRNYNQNAYVGDMIVEPDDGIQKHTLQLNPDVDPMQLQHRKEVRFKVNPK